MNRIRLLIALPNHELPPKSTTPGIGTLIHRQLQAMDHDQFEVTTICNATNTGNQIDTSKYKSIILPFRRSVFELIKVLPWRSRQFLFGIGSSLKAYRCLRIFLWILIRRNKFDAIVFHNYTAPAEWLIRYRNILQYKTKVIYYFHSSGVDRLLSTHKRLLNSDGIITISGESSNDLRYLKHINIINNYSRLPGIEIKVEEFNSVNKRPLRLISANTIEPNKGIDILISAIKILNSQKTKIKLDIYGLPKNEKYFENVLSMINSLADVNYHGFLNNSELLLKMRDYDLAVVLSQQREGNSMSAIEALVEAHIPVIGSNLGGIPFVLNYGKFGFILDDYQKPQALANLLSKLDQQRPLLTEKKYAIKSEADSYFSPDKSARSLSSFILEVLNT